jgi:ELWxxDGT repeat protein
VSLVKDILPGGDGSPDTPVEFNGALYYLATGPEGAELWRSDGTAAGTVLLKDVNPGSAGSSPYERMRVGNTLYFSAKDAVSGAELWKTDGTPAGTVRVKDIRPGADWSSPRPMGEVNGALLFSADDGVTGRELWKTDGTAAGTMLLKDLAPGGYKSQGKFYPYARNIGPSATLGGSVLFTLGDGPTGVELWKTDGTTAGTVFVKTLSPGSNSQPTELKVVGGAVYFLAESSEFGREVWRSDGTSAGTGLLKDIKVGSASSSPTFLGTVGGTLFFSASDGVASRGVWKTDGTEAGTMFVKAVDPEGTNSLLGPAMELNGTLLFSRHEIGFYPELWKTDGTAAGTGLVKDPVPGLPVSCAWCTPPGMTFLGQVGGAVYFSLSDDNSPLDPGGSVVGAELWKTDGTEAGTGLVKDILPGYRGSRPARGAVLNGSLYFSADDGTHGIEPWRVTPTACP